MRILLIPAHFPYPPDDGAKIPTFYLLKYLSRKYPRLSIKEIDISTFDGKRLNETLSNRLNLPPEKRLTAPSIFIGQDYILPGEITESRVETLIQKYQQAETHRP
jgi:hypothetical protein